MQEKAYHIRAMKREDLDTAIEWAAAEGWNPGLHDGDCFYAADPNGFFVGLLGDEPVGCISAVTYGQHYGFLGFYIVHPDWRGRGFGIQLWHRAMEYLHGRNVGLDGVVEQQANYRKSGFELAYRSVRYQTNGIDVRDALDLTTGVLRLADVPFETVAAYDTQLFGVARRVFLDRWLAQPKSVALGIVDGENLLGYGMLRKCRDGHKIGPLFADTPLVAETRCQALRSHAAADAPVFLDVPMANPVAVQIAEDHKMQPVFETARMYTQGEPGLPMHRWFGVTSFELG